MILALQWFTYFWSVVPAERDNEVFSSGPPADAQPGDTLVRSIIQYYVTIPPVDMDVAGNIDKTPWPWAFEFYLLPVREFPAHVSPNPWGAADAIWMEQLVWRPTYTPFAGDDLATWYAGSDGYLRNSYGQRTIDDPSEVTLNFAIAPFETPSPPDDPWLDLLPRFTVTWRTLWDLKGI
jgi:hypothetical protein